jgi:L-ascorbate metabolism protein UlaG (beta-lactamase superfamily)
VAVTWLGGTTVLLASPSGKSLLVDPAPENPTREKVDAILLTSSVALGHVSELVRARNLPVVALPDAARWLARSGVTTALQLNLGGSLDVLGVRVTTVRADHVGPVEEGLSGASCGYVVTFGNGSKVYCSGRTALSSDMALVGEVYKPDLVLLAISEQDGMGPLEAAHAVKLLRAKRVAPLLARAPLGRLFRAHLEELGLEKVHVLDLVPGQVASF